MKEYTQEPLKLLVARLLVVFNVHKGISWCYHPPPDFMKKWCLAMGFLPQTGCTEYNNCEANTELAGGEQTSNSDYYISDRV